MRHRHRSQDISLWLRDEDKVPVIGLAKVIPTDKGSIVPSTAKVKVKMENILQSDFIISGLKPHSLQTLSVPDWSDFVFV